MADVICDTSFLIHLFTRRIRNIDGICSEIGSIRFVVPTCVLAEIAKLAGDPRRAPEMSSVLERAAPMDPIEVGGGFADDAILRHVSLNGGFVATMDRELKRRIKAAGGSILSVSRDRIVLEP